MSDYRISKVGHDEALIDLTVLSPQPKSEGLQVTQRSHAADGTIWDQGLYFELVYEIAENATKLAAILTAFGLNAAKEVEVTLYAPNAIGTYTRWNGLAIQPVVSHRNYFYQNVTVLIKNIEVAA